MAKKKSLDNQSKIDALLVLKQSEGWKILVENLEANKEYLSQVLITRRDPETNIKLEEDTLEDASRKYALSTDLINSPDNLIEWLKEPKQEIENLDPYA
jgi:hypothetical protein